MTSTQKLSPEDWIKAAFRALTLGGPHAIRIEPIARQLKHSKGSFYWHFKDLAALKRAMITHWQRRATAEIIADVEAAKISPAAQLRLLVALTTDGRVDLYGGAQVEMAIRDWGRYDPAVAKVQDQVDAQRLAYVTALFEKSGHSAKVSAQNANILYGVLIGLESLSRLKRISTPKDLLQLLETLLPNP